MNILNILKNLLPISSFCITKHRNSVQGLISLHFFNTRQDFMGFS